MKKVMKDILFKMMYSENFLQYPEDVHNLHNYLLFSPE